MNILHITDFHIDDPAGEGEKLREGFYIEFIDGLYDAVTNQGITEIGLVINTGDFINKGKTENYPHAKKVLEYILKKFGIAADAVAVTIGNHDFKMKEPGTLEEKRRPFLDFSKDFVAGKEIGSTEIAKLYHNEEKKIQVLVIDNASREDDTNKPVTTTVTEQDNISKLVRENNLEKDLIVISHYPMLPFPLAKYSQEDPDWINNHVWPAGYSLQERISNTKSPGRCFFFCGDGHIPDAFRKGNAHFIMTGMLGGDYAKRHSSTGKSFYMQIQARVYNLDGETKLTTFNYVPNGFDYDVSNGKWTVNESRLREISEPKKTEIEQPKSRTTALSEPLELEIVNRVKKENLYKLGRYATSSEYNSLSWVSINRLFEEQQLLVSVIDKGIDWLSKILKDYSKSLLIGVDFYGAIIASHLAIRLDIPHRCFGNHFPYNVDTSYLSEIIKAIHSIGEVKDIIIVTDVVASGHSVLKIIKGIEEEMISRHQKPLETNFHSISVISDQSIVRQEFDEKLSTIKTACGILKMPIIKTSELPDKDVLSCSVDFTV